MASSKRQSGRKAAGGTAGAVTAREHRARLLAALFRLYDADEEFKRSLAGLIPLAEAAITAHGPVPGRIRIDLLRLNDPEPNLVRLDVPEVARYLVAARSVVSRFGLQRLGSDGLRQVLAWCDRYVRAHASGLAPSAYGPGTLGTVRPDVVFEPEVVGIVPSPWKREEWSPTQESRTDARRRLEARAGREIQRALDVIERETVEGALLAYPRKVPNFERDIGWLYEKLRWDRSYQELYNGLTPPPRGGVETVRKAVERAARRLGVDRRGWESGWR